VQEVSEIHLGQVKRRTIKDSNERELDKATSQDLMKARKTVGDGRNLPE
jgi:hypothetical protein